MAALAAPVPAPFVQQVRRGNVPQRPPRQRLAHAVARQPAPTVDALQEAMRAEFARLGFTPKAGASRFVLDPRQHPDLAEVALAPGEGPETITGIGASAQPLDGSITFYRPQHAALRGLAAKLGRPRSQLSEVQQNMLRLVSHEYGHLFEGALDEGAAESFGQDMVAPLARRLFGASALPIRDRYIGYEGITKDIRGLSVARSGGPVNSPAARRFRSDWLLADEARRQQMAG